MAFPSRPLTKKRWVLELLNHFNYVQLNIELWGLVFEKLVERHVFEHDQSGRGKYILIASLEERTLLEALNEVRESIAAKL